MTTLAAGSSATFTLGSFQTLNIKTGGVGTLLFTSVAPNAVPSFTAAAVNGNFGPYNTSMTVVMTMTAGSAGYTISGGADVTAVTNAVTGEITLSQIDSRLIRSSGYFCHLFAGNQSNGDAKFYDISGALNDGSFGANLALTDAWATAGFCSTLVPPGGTPDTSIRLPALNFDYAAGESLLIFWKGRCTPPGSNQYLIGDIPNSSTKGLAIRAEATGKVTPLMSDGTGKFMVLSTSVVLSATVTHSYCLAVDGKLKKYTIHEDGVEVWPLTTYNSGVAFDTRSEATLNIGTGSPAPGGTGLGVASSTQALIILRGRVVDGVPIGLPTGITALMQRMHRNPAGLISADDW